MSQRGSRPKGAPNKHESLSKRGRYMRTIILMIAALTLIPTLTLIAQDAIAPQHTLSLKVDGSSRQVVTRALTVNEVLLAEKVTLGKYDVCQPAVTAEVKDGLAIVVTRKTFETIREKVAIAPPVITRWDRRLTKTPLVLNPGTPGVAMQTRCIWKKDGVVSQQWVQNKQLIQKPKAKIVVRGNLPSRGITGRKVLTCVSTAYDPSPSSCGKYADGYTAIGMRATKGIIAVDPRVIPLGTRVYVEGYGPAIAADTGGAIKGHKIDVCFDTRREALNWGRRTVKVVILK